MGAPLLWYTSLTRDRLPKLNNSLAKSVYIERKNGVAKVDERKLLAEDSRRLAGLPKVCADPTDVVKSKKVEFLFSIFLIREENTHQALKQISTPF